VIYLSCIPKKAALFGCVILAGCGHEAGFPPSVATSGGAQTEVPSTNYKLLYSFRGYEEDGSNPLTSLIALNGTFYGTTSTGGIVGHGTFFSLSSSGKERTLHSFGVNNDGFFPSGLIAVGGTFYGTTGATRGGDCSCGAVFAVSPTGKERLIYRFKGGYDGSFPAAGLIALNGELYGTTSIGGSGCLSGSSGCGTVFAITSAGKERIVYSFKGGSDGARPQAALFAHNGMLYGTTQRGGASKACSLGCGTVFEVSTSGKERVLHRFTAHPDGAVPLSTLVFASGRFYGTTKAGGTANKGTVFEVSSTGKERVLYDLAGAGSAPQAGLILVNGLLYGTTSTGGRFGYGTVFAIGTTGRAQSLHNFKGYPDGSDPYARLFAQNGMLYGTTYSGGAFDRGSVFAIAL
jgi:uncharacterized repeat protein (TIGR03803 family)